MCRPAVVPPDDPVSPDVRFAAAAGCPAAPARAAGSARAGIAVGRVTPYSVNPAPRPSLSPVASDIAPNDDAPHAACHSHASSFFFRLPFFVADFFRK